MTVIDVHAHVSETKELATWSTEGYEIWEYGPHDGVRFGTFAGDLDDLEVAMDHGGIDHTVIVHNFTAAEWQSRAIDGFRSQSRVADSASTTLADELVAFNEWLVREVRDRPRLTPFVAVDPLVLGREATRRHLETMVSVGARGVKVHPVEQRFRPDDPRFVELAEECVRLGLPMTAHSGPSRDGADLAEPLSFVPLLETAPTLQLIVAHLGGATWKQAPTLAEAFPDVLFDCSEIVSWVGAPNAPNAEHLVELIRDIGVDRVMFGSDFPWYDPGVVADQVRELPGLNQAELDAILGENAMRALGLLP
jgi:predicted TIM-barrel fold metal-dependent hydrolase